MTNALETIRRRLAANEPVAILFDCDGTLVDSAGVIAAVMHRAFTKLDEEPVSDEAVRDIIGLSLEIAIGKLTKKPADSARVADLTAAYKSEFFLYRSEPSFSEPAFDGIPELLSLLRQQDAIICGVVTGKSRRGLDTVAAHHGFEWMLPVSRTADECASKPAPDMVLECCAQCGIEPAHTLVIGDTSYDMQMAKSAGAIAVGVEWGYHKPDILLSSGAGIIIDKPMKINDLLGLKSDA
jgi:phosphoglycolate phosphatase